MRSTRIHSRLAPGSTDLFPDVTVVMTGIDLQATPPCEIKEFEAGTPVPLIVTCGKPSVERVKMKFPCCGAVYIRFICQSCLDLLKLGGDGWECDEDCHVDVKPEWTVI